MTTEELLQAFCEAGRKAFRKDKSMQKEVRKLNRHEPIIVGGQEMRFWKEVMVYKTAEHVRDVLPDCELTVVLDGNNSYLEAELTDEEHRKLTTALYAFLKKWNCL